MARLVVGSRPFDMTAWDLSDIATGTVTLDSATVVDITGAGGHFTYRFAGSGFTTFDANGFPTGGTITSFGQDIPGKTPLVITGLSISAATFMGFVNTNDANGFENAIFAGNDSFAGRAGDDVLLGFGGNDGFNLTKGGDDTAQGGAGNDLFQMGGALAAADSIDGGTGTDRMILSGDYSAGLTFAAATMTNVETLQLVRGHSYDLVLNDGNVAAGQVLAVKATALAAADTLIFDGSAETDGGYGVLAGAGNDTLTGGAANDVLEGENGNDTIDISHGGNDNAIGGAGDDTFTVGAALTLSDKIDGGSGNDTVIFDGDYAAATTLDIHQFGHIERVVFTAGHDYDIRLNFSDTSSSLHTMQTVDASALGAGDHFTFIANGPPNIGLLVTVTGGAGDDSIDVQTGWQTTIDESRGGDDTVTGSSQGQTDVVFGATFTTDDVVHGGHFTDISLDGDYSAGLVLNASHLTNISQLYLHSDFDYDLTFQGDVGASVNGIEIDSTEIEATGHSATIDASAVTTRMTVDLSSFNSFHIEGGSGGGSYSLTSTAASSMVGGSGADSIGWTGFASGDTVDGGGGADVLGITFNGTLSSSLIKNVETLNLTGSNVTLNNNLIAAGQQMTIQTFGTTTVDGSAETDGTIAFTAAGGSIGTPITLIGGAGDDSVDQTAGALVFTGGGGADTITMSPFFPSSGTVVYHAASESTGVNFDTIVFFTTDRDVFDMPSAVTGIDTTVSSGALTTANFDSNLATAINAAHLAAHHAVEFAPTSGNYVDDVFLIVDLNGHAGYQAGQDIVIAFNADGALSTANFI